MGETSRETGGTKDSQDAHVTRILWLVATLVGSLALVGVLVHAGEDTILVPAPEQVAASFLEQLAAERYSEALSYLSDEPDTGPRKEDLEQFASELQNRFGPIEQAHPGGARIGADEAEALALIQTDRTRAGITFPMVREKGLWKIARLPGIR
jgi:hypothetical protein